MPKYIVNDTPIKHGGEGKQGVRVYGPGDIITLTKAAAGRLGANVSPIEDSRFGGEADKDPAGEAPGPKKKEK